MTPQTARITFSRSSLLLLCGLSGLLVFHEGCAVVGPSTGSNNATVSGGVAQVCFFCSSAIAPETITQLKAQGVTEDKLNKLYTVLGLNNIPPEALDHELKAIAQSYFDFKKRPVQSSSDPEVAALLQQARHAGEDLNFPLAERLFNEASQRDEQAAQDLQQVATTRLTSAAAAQAANGDLQTVQLNFVKAQAYYRKALQLLPSSDKEHQGQYLNSLGNSLLEAGIRTKGSDIQKFLREAVTAYREALTVRTKDRLPQEWATTQNNLGLVLWDQGIPSDGAASTRLLAEADCAFRAALTVRTRDQVPQQWAMTKNNLGNLLREQSTRTTGKAGTRLLAEAVAVYREALTVRTKEQLPQDWAMTQNNLGAALGDQGMRTTGEAGKELIRQAISAYELSLEVTTREALPVQ